MNDIPEKNRIYLDECGICHKLQRTHGYSPVGEAIHGLTYGKRKGRTNVIGAWSCDRKLFSAQTYDLTVDKNIFVRWLKKYLLPALEAGMVVIMDNAPWHKGEDIKALIESTGAKLLKLPPYSPDLNPIEKAWANLKNAIKKAKKAISDITENIKIQIKNISKF